MHGPGADDDADGAIASINIIPLVDVVLVLLIIFMVTTVFSRESKQDFKLPKGQEASTMSKAPNEINVTVAKSGEILVNGKPAKMNELAARITKAKSSTRKNVIVLRGDERAMYKNIFPALQEVNKSGVEITLAYLPGKKK